MNYEETLPVPFAQLRERVAKLERGDRDKTKQFDNMEKRVNRIYFMIIGVLGSMVLMLGKIGIDLWQKLHP